MIYDASYWAVALALVGLVSITMFLALPWRMSLTSKARRVGIVVLVALSYVLVIGSGITNLQNSVVAFTILAIIGGIVALIIVGDSSRFFRWWVSDDDNSRPD